MRRVISSLFVSSTATIKITNVREHIPETARPIFTQCFLRVTCRLWPSLGFLLAALRCVVYISGFMNDVIFARDLNINDRTDRDAVWCMDSGPRAPRTGPDLLREVALLVGNILKHARRRHTQCYSQGVKDLHPLVDCTVATCFSYDFVRQTELAC